MRLKAALLAACLLSCKDDGGDAGKNQPAPTPAAPQEATPADTRARAIRILDWIDPDAIGVVFMRLPEDLDVAALSVIYALPPRAERLLLDVSSIVDDLDAVLEPEAPRPTEWMTLEALAMVPVMAAGTYVIRGLKRPRAEVEPLLIAGGMRAEEQDGFPMLFPEGAFPWKIAFLSDDVLAFIPVKEIGTGLSPLTAARDLPPSDLDRELTKTLEGERDALLEMYVQGPLVHLDLAQELAGFRFSLRTWNREGIDGQALLQPVRDPAEAAKTLEARKAPLETAVVRSLVERAAYSVDAQFVTGRLQLTPDDLRSVREIK